ncbi:hypothetical protein LOZ66_000706 [Ophidiomyces ophidiicola]|nr:hypothetical protein LOZ66_000706 [Ophidiomyces ophidiicola]
MSKLAVFPIQSRNLGSPPESNDPPSRNLLSQPTQPRSTIASQLRHLRELISEFQGGDLEQRDRALETLDRELEELSSTTASSNLLDRPRTSRSGDNSERRERLRRVIQEASTSLQSHLIHSGSRPVDTSRRHRPAMAANSQVADAHFEVPNEINSTQQGEAIEQTEGAGSRENSSDRHHSNRRRNKRVKLDSDDKREGIRGFSYGHYGQVVPGPLEMEILSCDGGACGVNGRSSWPENILLNDNSVFSAKSERCNIILRHQGQTPFCLNRLIIKAPESGLAGPSGIREGMIFVTMTPDEMLNRTARYHILYSSRRHRYSVEHGNRRFVKYRTSVQRRDRTVLVHPNHPPYCRHRTFNPADADAAASQSPAPDFHVVVQQHDGLYDAPPEDDSVYSLISDVDEEETDDDCGMPCLAELDSEESDDDVLESSDRLLHDLRRQVRRPLGVDPRNQDLRSRFLSHFMTLPPGAPADSTENAAGQGPNNEQVLAPHAKFSIGGHNDAVTIKFNPPV